MNKLLNINSLFTKLILAILSFAVIVCIFIPYLRIPAVEARQEVDAINKTLDRKVGKNQSTFNISDFVDSVSPVYEIYEDEALTKIVDKTKVPLTKDSNTYYLAIYAYGYDVNNKDADIHNILLKTYKLTLNKDTKNNSKTIVETDLENSAVSVRVPKTTTFNFMNVLSTKNAWYSQKSQVPKRFSTDDELSRRLNSVPLEEGKALEPMYIAVALLSDIEDDNVANDTTDTTDTTDTADIADTNDTTNGEQTKKMEYVPLDTYLLYLERDGIHNSLPVVGEIGGSLLSEQKGNKMEFYDEDRFMLLFMIVGAVSTLFALILPNKFKLIELVIAELMGIGLIVLPILDTMFYTKYNFEIDPGVYILIVLGVLIMLAAVWDYIRCTAEYKAEMIHIYGEDYFNPERKAAIKAEFKEKDIAYKAELKAEKEALKAEKVAAKEALKAQKK